MSASETGDSLPLVQWRRDPRKVVSATCPASRSAATRRLRCARGSTSVASNGQPFHPQRGRIGAVAKLEIIRRCERAEDLGEMAGDRHLADRIAARAVLDPEPGGTATIVA